MSSYEMHLDAVREFKERAERAEKLCKVLCEELLKIDKCPVCNGTGKWHPECPACLAGEPSYCTCSKEDSEPCVNCGGTGHSFFDNPELLEALADAKEAGL